MSSRRRACPNASWPLAAVEDVGFGVFVNVPGFEDSFQKEVFGLAGDLFSRSLEWKRELGTGNSYALRGYFRADDIPGSHKVWLIDPYTTQSRLILFKGLR